MNERDLITYGDADLYLRNFKLAGKTDWRLPTIRELESLFDRTTVNPAIDPVFADTPIEGPSQTVRPRYWSSTSLGGWIGQSLWTFDFQYEQKSGTGPQEAALVRAVRTGP